MKQFLITTLAAITFAGAALAADAEDSASTQSDWAYKSYQQNVDTNDRDRLIDYSYQGGLIYTTSTEVPGILFSCSERHGLGVALATEAINFDTAFEQIDRRSRWRSVTATVGDDEPVTGRWVQLPRIGTVEPESKAMRAKLYNAVLLGEPVTIKIPGRSPVTINFPPVDAEFERWAMGCPITNPNATSTDSEQSDLEFRTDNLGSN